MPAICQAVSTVPMTFWVVGVAPFMSHTAADPSVLCQRMSLFASALKSCGNLCVSDKVSAVMVNVQAAIPKLPFTTATTFWPGVRFIPIVWPLPLDPMSPR